MSEPACQLEQGQPRYATPEDRPHFVRLWKAMLTELYEGGSRVLPDEHNLYLAWDYFDAYTTGRLDGAVVFWEADGEPVGVAMGGADYREPVFHLDREGRWGRLWGVYVEPPYRGTRAGLKMELFGEEKLRAKGFTHVTTSVRAGNTLGEANWRHWDGARKVEPVETIIAARLGESPCEES